MSAGFSKVYEQWLKESQNGIVIADDQRSNEDPNGLSELMDSDSSIDEEEEQSAYHKSSLPKDSRRPSVTDPGLVDDSSEDETILVENCGFDEPPILEPVSRMGQLQKQNLNEQMIKKGETTSFVNENNVKIHSVKSKSTKICKNPINFKSLKHSDNLFDKFNNASFCQSPDNPPPLIPSPDAPSLHSESPEREKSHDIKTQNYSPDYCAMEADSTSEVLGDFASASKIKPSSVEDMVCDSTCMLGGSPMVVSPSNCNNELEVKETDEARTSEQAQATISNGEPIQKQYSGVCQHKPKTNSKIINKLSILEMFSEKNPQNVDDFSERPEGSLELNPSVSSHHPSTVIDEPPILSAMHLPLNLRKVQKRRGSKTNMSHPKVTKKKSVSNKQPEELWEVDRSVPPVLPCMSNDSINPIIIRQSKPLLTSSKSKAKNLRENNAKTSSSHFHKSFPFVKMEEYANNLPDSLRQFVIASWQLSALQTSIYNLTKELFPTFRKELMTMTPESQAFQQFLKDLFETMKQEEPAIGVTLPHTLNSNQNSSLYLNSNNHTDILQSVSETHLNSQDETLSTLSLRRSARQSTCTLKDLMASDIMDQFSRLELNKKSLHVSLNHIGPAHLQEFSVFCCQLLQLLLPDLSISLTNELAEDPSVLINFLDNVSASNKKKKSNNTI